ncbi:hypothetical protein lerEdw1_001370, partial [Lerista edwardsae]
RVQSARERDGGGKSWRRPVPECHVCAVPILVIFIKRVSDQGPEIMAGKPKLYYFDGRGRMESIRWLLGAAGVEFVEEIVETREQFDKLVQDGLLLFQQVPMVEIDGMKMVQTRAILNYIAAKYNLCGKDLKENALYCNQESLTSLKIHMYVEGILDLMRLVMIYPFILPEEQEKQAALIAETATKKYFPVYEKVLKDHGQDFLVGNQFSWADVALLEAILAVEEKSTNVMPEFPQLQSFKERISNLPTVKKFLEPGGQRKPLPDEKYVESVKNVLYMYKNVKLKAGAAV